MRLCQREAFSRHRWQFTIPGLAPGPVCPSSHTFTRTLTYLEYLSTEVFCQGILGAFVCLSHVYHINLNWCVQAQETTNTPWVPQTARAQRGQHAHQNVVTGGDEGGRFGDGWNRLAFRGITCCDELTATLQSSYCVEGDSHAGSGSGVHLRIKQRHTRTWTHLPHRIYTI